MHQYYTRVLGFVAIIGLSTAQVGAVPVTATDFDGLTLGAKIVGPVGSEVEVTLINTVNSGEGVGDLSSSVSCPDGFASCTPPSNPSGTIYTYVHTVTPGVDFPNDAPFPEPGTIVPFDNVSQFELGFAAEGFNGVAGYSFSEANTTLGGSDQFAIEHQADGSLSWSLSSGGWDTGESITFFWQTTQPPSGPGGVYSINDGSVSGSGPGPLPTAVVPEPISASLLGIGIGLICAARSQQRRLNLAPAS